MSVPRIFHDQRPEVRLPGDARLLSDFADEIGQHLVAAEIYTRRGVAVRVDPHDKTLREVTADELRSWVEEHLVCIKMRRFGEGEFVPVRKTMSLSDASGVLAAPQLHARLRPIERVHPVRMPMRRKDGWIELLPEGYDTPSQTLTLAGGPPINKLPVEYAKQIINDLFEEFAFADARRSRAVAISAMLTCFGAGILPDGSLRPCFLFVANAEGAGKSLLCKLACVPVLGYAPAGCAPKDEDEMRKVLLSAVLEARPLVFFDNVRGHIQSQALEGFLTAQTWSGRILGGNRTFNGRNLATVVISGNRVTVSPDMRRRSLLCELFMAEERAEDRTFLRPLETPQILERQGEILSALWTLVEDWHAGMEPRPSRGHTAFTEWAATIGAIVEHAGFGCPVETPETDIGSDQDLADMRSLVATGAEGASMRTLRFDDLVDLSVGGGLFERLGLSEALSPKERSAFARLLKGYDGRLIGDFRFTIEGKGHQRRFKIERRTDNPCMVTR